MVKRIPPPTISGGVVGIPASVKFFFRNHGPAMNPPGRPPAVHSVRSVRAIVEAIIAEAFQNPNLH